MIFINY